MNFNNDDKSLPGRQPRTSTAICIILTISLFPAGYCIGFMWQGFGSSGDAEVVSVSRAEQLPHVRSKLAPEGSKMGPLLARAEP